MELISTGQVNEYLRQAPEWTLENNGKSIKKIFEFQDFDWAVIFINKIAEIVEEEGHCPEMRLYDQNKVEVILTTPALGGLTEKDFKTATEIDGLTYE